MLKNYRVTDMNKIKSFFLLLFAFLIFTSSNKQGDAVNKSAEKKGKEIAQTLNFEFLWFGTGHMIDTYQHIFTWSFVSQHKWRIEESRTIIIYMVDILWKHVNDDKVFLDYQLYMKTFDPKTKPYLYPERIGFKLSFWDDNYDRPLTPYLAQIIYMNEKFYYYYADQKTQALQEPIVETLEAARQKIKTP